MVQSNDHAFGPNYLGQYFNYYNADVSFALGGKSVASWKNGHYLVKNLRTGKTATVVMWSTPNGGSKGEGHGRYTSGASKGQWQTGDRVVFVTTAAPTHSPTPSPTSCTEQWKSAYTGCQSHCDGDRDGGRFPCTNAYDGGLSSQTSCRTGGQSTYGLTMNMGSSRTISKVRVYVSDNGGAHTGFSKPRLYINGREVWSSTKAFGRFGRHCAGCSSIDGATNRWVEMSFSPVTASSFKFDFAGADQRSDSMFIVHEVQYYA
jgi:hypothetical protein